MQFLENYGRIDIALDPFSFAGGMTTCEAIGMGVPVITWPGETLASRHSCSYIHAIGLPELIASSAEDYVEIAMNLGQDRTRLQEDRSRLRNLVERSPLCDGKQFVCDLARLLREIRV